MNHKSRFLVIYGEFILIFLVPIEYLNNCLKSNREVLLRITAAIPSGSGS